MNKDDQAKARAEMLAKVKKIVEEKGSDAAIEFIQEQGDFRTIVNSYNNLIGDLYWKEKALDAVVPIANAGIKYCLDKSQEFAKTDPETSTKLKILAKVFSANLASFTWPGWDEEGITVTDADLKAGLEAAKLNLRLVEELGSDPAQLSNSHWSIGAHHLAAKDYQKAIDAFNQAASKARAAEKKDGELMNSGYAAMARMLKGEDAQTDFDAAVEALKELGTDDANFYAQQLEDVLKVFSR
jgi:tetratricopeptide (TPR) repeat protein